MTVNVDSPRLSICSCSHLPVKLSLLPSQPSKASQKIAVGVLHLSVCQGVPVHRLSEQVNWAGLISQLTPRTCILTCHPIPAVPEQGVGMREPVLFSSEHNNVQFYRLSINITNMPNKEREQLPALHVTPIRFYSGGQVQPIYNDPTHFH